MSISADFAQTFYVDGEAVGGAGYAFLNSVHLYFKTKPASVGSPSSVSSGQLIPNPGVTVFICETKTINGIDTPDLTGYVRYGRSRNEYGSITTSDNGQTATIFSFPSPVPIQTGKSYAIVIRCDGNDTQYGLWRNKSGETYNGTQNPAVTKGALDGQFFVITNGTTPTPLVDTDLKFILKGQKFDTSVEKTYSVVNRNFEFLAIDKTNTTGTLLGGEAVFANTGYVSSQTVSVSTSSTTVNGTNTTFSSTFTVGDPIVFNSNTVNCVRTIASIANNTQLTISAPASFTNAASKYLVAPVGTVYDFNYLKSFCVLSASTANTTHNFVANATSYSIVGEISGASVKVQDVVDYPINYFTPEFKVLTPTSTGANLAVVLANSSLASAALATNVKMYDKNIFNDFKAYCFSRSTEVTDPSAVLDNGKSMNFDLTLSSTNEFVTPLIDEEDLILHTTSVFLNNNLTDENRSNGSAVSKIVTKKVNLANNQISEDIKAYVTAYKPSGTNVEVYVKFHNAEDYQSFDDTSWTRLQNVTPVDVVSSTDNDLDFVELEYSLATYPLSDDPYSYESSGTMLDAYFSVFVGENRLYTDSPVELLYNVSVNDVVRIFNPLFPNNSVITTVIGIDGNCIQVSTSFDGDDASLASFIGGGLRIERVTCPTSAFKNYVNSGILKYYNTGRSAYSGYNSFSIKIVLVGDDNIPYYPRVDDIRVVACSV